MTATDQNEKRVGVIRTLREMFLPERSPDGRGDLGRDYRGGGKAAMAPTLFEVESTSNQVCGVWPFSAGSGFPIVGAPLGRHLTQMATVCADPVNWFTNGMITNPSAFVLGQPGLGKSSLIRHMLIILAAQGVKPLVLSDLKPDYVDLGVELDCTIIKVGRGGVKINPLDAGPIRTVLPKLSESRRNEVIEQISGQRVNTLMGLVELVRGARLDDYEVTVLRVALNHLDPTLQEPPIIDDICAMVECKDPIIRTVVRDRDDDGRYQDRTEGLLDALNALSSQGIFGNVFASQTSELALIKPERGAVIDMSEVDESDVALQAGLQLTCWAYGTAIVHAARVAAESGLAPESMYVLVMDELWRALRASDLLVDRIDAITRLNRQMLFPQIMCTHTMDDLRLESETATAKAWGFVERSAMVFLGGLSPKEMGNLGEVFAMPQNERRMVNQWADSNALRVTGATTRAVPEGIGKFLLKLGDSPGIPFQVILTPLERGVHDTNKRWSSFQS